MVQLTFTASIALVQLALLAQTSVGLPIESGAMVEPQALATSDNKGYAQLSKRSPAGSGEGHVPKPPTCWWRCLGQKLAGKRAKPAHGKGGDPTEPKVGNTLGNPYAKKLPTQIPGEPNWGRMYDGTVYTHNVYYPLHKRPSGDLEARDWDDLELDARDYNDLDELRLSRRDDMELETREPGSSYGKRSLGNPEERYWLG